jgi:hypothetical protein
VLAVVGELLDLGLGADRVPDEKERSADWDLQDHPEEEDRPEPLHGQGV